MPLSAPMSSQHLLTFAQAAAQLHYPSVPALQRALIRTSILPIVIVSARKRFVKQSDLDAFLSKRTTKGA